MKRAVITDLHANRPALEAVLAHARERGAQSFALLGDLVGYGADPAWVLDTVGRLIEDGAVAVLGNHDEAVVKGGSNSMHEDARAVLDWTRAQLSSAHLKLLAGLPLTATRGDCLFVHANAYDPASWDYIVGRAQATRSLQATRERYSFCGHMHEPMLYNLSLTGKAGDFTPAPGMAIPLPSHRQWLTIPGACGQPRDGNPAACYALFDEDSATLTFERVPYDVEAAAARIRASAMPAAVAARMAERLALGR